MAVAIVIWVLYSLFCAAVAEPRLNRAAAVVAMVALLVLLFSGVRLRGL